MASRRAAISGYALWQAGLGRFACRAGRPDSHVDPGDAAVLSASFF
jgi:hypothetical protein